MCREISNLSETGTEHMHEDLNVLGHFWAFFVHGFKYTDMVLNLLCTFGGCYVSIHERYPQNIFWTR